MDSFLSLGVSEANERSVLSMCAKLKRVQALTFYAIAVPLPYRTLPYLTSPSSIFRIIVFHRLVQCLPSIDRRFDPTRYGLLPLIAYMFLRNKLRKPCSLPHPFPDDETTLVILRPKSCCGSSVLCRSLSAYSLVMSRGLLWTYNLLSDTEHKTQTIFHTTTWLFAENY